MHSRTSIANGWCLFPLVLVVALGACSESPRATPGGRALPAVGPRETVAALTKLRAERQYTELRALIVPGRGHAVVETLMAVDGFLDANRALCNWIRDDVGIGLSETIDQSWMADILGIFSRHVAVLDESIAGDWARVGYMVNDRLPALEAELRIVEGRWAYDPGGGYTPELPEAFREMARGLESVLADLQAGRIDRKEVQRESGALEQKVAARLQRGVSLLSKARIAAEQGRAE